MEEHILEDQQKEHHNNQFGRSKSNTWIYEGRIPPNVCDLIIEEFKYKTAELAKVGADSRLDTKSRNVKTVEVPRTHWVNGIPMYFGFDANHDNFNYTISDVAFTEFFTYEPGMFYKPHIDVNSFVNHPAHNRKLTVILQLSDETEYEGGELQIYNSNLKPITLTKKRGSVIIFDSFVPHCVKKIKSGTRYVLASWIIGTPFS